MVSQSLFYIKNNKTEEITQLTDINISHQLRLFFNYEHNIKFEKVEWIDTIDINLMEELLYNKDAVEVLKSGIILKDFNDAEGVKDLLNKNKKLTHLIYDTFKEINPYQTYERIIFYINDNFNFNNAKYFVELLKETGIKGYGLTSIMGLIKEYNYDTNTFLEYITRGFLRQGIVIVDGFISSYFKDYLQMEKEMYGKVKNKYPKYLKTEHDMIVRKYNCWKKYRNDLAIFDNNKEIKKWEYSNNTYSIIAPTCSADVLDEAIQQNNCVASYIDRIAKGETNILFMRYTNNSEESLVTIEVNKEDEVCQVKAYNNTDTTKEQDSFIKTWAEKNKLKITYKK